MLTLSKTFYGKEDPGLLGQLLPELSGIMNWALDGLGHVRARQRFIEPASAPLWWRCGTLNNGAVEVRC